MATESKAKMQWCEACQCDTLHVETHPTVCQRCGRDAKAAHQIGDAADREYAEQREAEKITMEHIRRSKRETDQISQFYIRAVRANDHVAEGLCQRAFGLKVIGDKVQRAFEASEWAHVDRDVARAEVLRRIAAEVH